MSNEVCVLYFVQHACLHLYSKVVKQ